MMGNASSSARPPTLESIKQLNESIWEFCSPDYPEVEVIFFHGLHKSNWQEAFWKTWLSRDDSVIWPKAWLSECLPKARILSVSYDSSLQKHDGAPDSFIIAENLIQDMIQHAQVGQNCPVILVGHSLGAIIIKEVVLGCMRMRWELRLSTCQTQIDEINNFLGNCKGVFYYSPMDGGSRILDRGSPIWSMNEPLIKLLKTLSTDTARLNYRFASTRSNLGIKTQAIGENKKTTFMGITAKFVEEAAARLSDVDLFYTAQDSDHFEVCKPKDKTSVIFKHLEAFINELKSDKSEIIDKEKMKRLSGQENTTFQRADAWAAGNILSRAEEDEIILWLVKCLAEHDNLAWQGAAAWALSSLTEMDRKRNSTTIRVRIAKKKGAIDGLVKCLSEYYNPNLQEAAAWVLCDLFHIGHDDAIRSSIATEDGAIPGLVKCLSAHNDPDLQEAAAWNLCHLAEIDDSLKLSIANEEGAIAGLVRCLVKPKKPEIQDAAAYTLCGLIGIRGHDPIKLRIAKEIGAIASLVRCLSLHDSDLEESVTDALRALAETGDRVGDPSIRSSIAKEGGANVLR